MTIENPRTSADAGSRGLGAAELLYRSGRIAEAAALLQASDPVDPLDDASAVRAKVLLGTTLFDLGKVNAALPVLHDAVAVSEGRPPAEQFTAIMSLFTRESEFQSPNEALHPLSRLRQMAASIGDALSLTGLHLAVARLEACRGHCVDAHKHLEIARSLVHRLDRPSVSCALDLVDASLGGLAGNLARAIGSARAGLQRASAHGLALPTAALAGTLGMLLLARGNTARARTYLEEALSLGGEASFIRLPVLDTLALLALFENDLDACRRYSDKCSAVIAAQELPARSWYDFAHDITRCAYLEATGGWPDIITIVDAADPELARRQLRSLRAELLSAKARALAALGRHAAADTALAAALRTCPRGAAAPMITVEAAKAVCLSRRGAHEAAAIHFDRALSACRAIGHTQQERNIERDFRAAEHDVHITAAVQARPRAIDPADLTLRLDDVTTILRAGHSIDIIAHRVVALLQGTALGERVTVESESGCEYAPRPFASFETQADGTSTITIRGSDRRVTIALQGVNALDDIALVKNLADLVQAGVHRTADAGHDEDDLELWPQAANPGDDDVVFRSPRMVELLKVAQRLAATNLPILITGETGTGKEVVARLIHEHSLVKRGPFVAFNCSALPRELVESQLFGHRRGAFTGAIDSFPGVIRSAERGTLFLDEIGDLETGVQPKLLRFLEQAEVHPVGEARPHRVSVRVVAATNADLERLANEGRLRRDLYYRLGVARIALPSLRERKDEIPALTALFVMRYAREFGRANLTIGDDLMAALLLYDWPGNIRQLSNELRRLVAMAESGRTLRSTELDPEISRRLRETRLLPDAASPDAVPIRLDQTLDSAIEELERAFITRAMTASSGRVSEAAHLLGLSRKGLFLKRRRWGLSG